MYLNERTITSQIYGMSRPLRIVENIERAEMRRSRERVVIEITVSSHVEHEELVEILSRILSECGISLDLGWDCPCEEMPAYEQDIDHLIFLIQEHWSEIPWSVRDTLPASVRNYFW